MRVTVMSPVSAEVTIAQAEKWLERNGWLRHDPVAPGTWYDAWTNDSAADTWTVHVPTCHPDPPEAMAELISDIARAMGKTPACVLEEMGRCVP